MNICVAMCSKRGGSRETAGDWSNKLFYCVL